MKISFNKHTPFYELMYVKWSGIGYDKDKLVKLVKIIIHKKRSIMIITQSSKLYKVKLEV